MICVPGDLLELGLLSNKIEGAYSGINKKQRPFLVEVVEDMCFGY